MEMSQIVLDRLIDEVCREPRKAAAEALLATQKARAELSDLRGVIDILRSDLGRERLQRHDMEVQKRSADLPLTKLWQEADNLLRFKSSSRGARADLERKLRAALTAAEPHVDLIPF